MKPTERRDGPLRAALQVSPAQLMTPLKDLVARARARLVRPGGSVSHLIEPATTLLLICMGIVLRLNGVVFGRTIGFWNDEANWAARLMGQPLQEFLIRPMGFMALTRLSASLFGNWEFAFRLLPWLAGLLILPVAVWLAHRFLNRPAARLIFIGILCLSPYAVDFSKEFKPYGVSLLFHLLLPLLALRWLDTRRTFDLVLVGIAAPLGLLFAQDVIFLYPGLFLVLGWGAWQKRSFRQLGAVFGFAVLSASIVLGMYLLIWRRLPKNQEKYWGDKYGVFYRPKDKTETAVNWYAEKYTALAKMPGERRRVWEIDGEPRRWFHELRAADALVWLLLHLAGLTVIVTQRRVRDAALFLSPALVCALFNYLGLWPFGLFRTNLFMLAGMTAVASLGFDWKGREKFAWTVPIPVALLVLLPFLAFQSDWGAKKTVVLSSQMAEMVEQLLQFGEREHSKRDPFFLDHNSFNVFRYYVRHHAKTSKLRPEVDRQFAYQYKRKAKDVFRAVRKLRPNKRAWIMVRDREQPPADIRPQEMLRMGKHAIYLVHGPERD